MAADVQQNQNNTSAPFMDDARYNSLTHDVYSAGLNDTHW
jgi:hypothetical protein